MTLDIEALIDAKIPLADCKTKWDLFVSAFNESQRVQATFTNITARNRIWWIIPEYGYAPGDVRELPDPVFLPPGTEAEVVKAGLEACQKFITGRGRICFDITGLMRPQILFLMAHLKAVGLNEYDLLYTEPEKYSRRAETRFSIGEDVEVRSVAGYIGAHENNTSGDVLVLGIGYDHHLISQAIQAKEGARILQLHSFPSLSADMYHESILRLDRISGDSRRVGDETYYSSANDPFVVASSLKAALAAVDSHRRITNTYLSPLATKPQAVGFGLYYLKNLIGSSASIIFPNCPRYDRETSSGIGRSWVYPIFLD